MKKRLYTILGIIVVALIVTLPVFAGISGSGASGVQIQNLSTTSAVNVVVELWNQNGSAPIEVSGTGGDSIAAATAKTYYLPTLPGVPDGAYAMGVSAGGPIAGIARTDWSAVGGAATYNSSAPGTDVLIPLVTANFAGQTSQFSIQNTNTAAGISDVDIEVLGRGVGSLPGNSLTNEAIPAGTSVTYDMGTDFGSLPNTGVDLGVSTGFVGSVRITSATPLVVQSFIDIPGTRGVGGFAGVASASADTTLYCPLIRSNYYGDTGINIVNPSTTSSVDVEITFEADALSPNGGTYTQDITVPANSMAIAFQGLTGNSRQAPTNLPGGTQGPDPIPTNDGFFGVATLDADGDILAVVNDTVFGGGWVTEKQSSYNCATAAGADSTFALPLVRQYHLAAERLTTGISIQNISGSSVTASVDVYNWDGTRQAASDPADITIPAYGSGNFWEGFWTNLPTVPPDLGGSGWFGSAVVTITGGEAVVLVDDQGFGSVAIDSANYNGFPIE
jgi:hypothetical protein